jgi:hypothetical protein
MPDGGWIIEILEIALLGLMLVVLAIAVSGR